MSNEESSIENARGGSVDAQAPDEVEATRDAAQASESIDLADPEHTSGDTLPLPNDIDGAQIAGASQAAVATALASGSANLEGVVLSERYRVGKCLGVGGMGTVWRAEHTLMKKTVAIKVLHHDIVGRGEAVERFRREAQAAAHIDHPNVCVATDFGEMEQRGFFLVMEYLEGQTLDETLATVDRLPPDRAIHIIDQILSALEQAHQFGVVHRDLKPENIMLVERDGDPDFVKIMDFGIARVPMAEEQDDARLTRVGRVYGTPMYMSPEQASGETGIESRSDLYTVGVMLFEMLTGTLPFIDKSSVKLMAMHLTEPAPSLRKRAPEARLPKSLDRLVLQLMAKDPDDRPATAAEVRAELARIKQGGNTQTWVSVTRDAVADSSVALRRAARPLKPHLRRARAWVKENPQAKKAILGALLVLIICVPLGAVFIFSDSAADNASAQSMEEQENALASERREYIEQIEASALINALAMGDAQGALQKINALISEHGDNPHLHFLSARAHIMDETPQEALAAYQKAIAAEPRYGSVKRVRDDILDQFRGGDDALQELAADILINALPRAETNAALSEMARMGKGASLRRRAKSALEQNGRLAELEPWNRASIELRFANGCTEHRDAIEKIVAANDPRGLEIIYYYDDRPRRGCGTFKRDDCYGCIRADLEKAIMTLPPAELLPAGDSAEDASSPDSAP
ncbi:serine/threonine-protein kinase [Bradymonas sediminis]|uniref:non-specific serine/threonine protein kinase n=1 Tax=Bradymonas sediminis TaxID=1548548 RepID=A0A2Z4FHM9_9DELT|nr:serine/threonine-protein kinase [Bradymonas sediminis]AWV88512.1 hypothetical protein DN745_03800 [Bradymonas sediminis]TDP77649.1 serine/threonine protein kinase [Bradymonas sediminis]